MMEFICVVNASIKVNWIMMKTVCIIERNFSNLFSRIKSDSFFKLENLFLLNQDVKQINVLTFQSPLIVNYSNQSNHLETLANNILGTTSLSDYEKNKKEDLMKSLDVLFSCGINKSDLRKYDELLRKFSSHAKISYLIKIKKNPTELLPLLALPLPTLQTAANHCQEDRKQNMSCIDRLTYLQEQLQLPLSDLANLIVKHPALLTLAFSKLDRKMKILKQGQISVEFIVKDAWIFNYNEKLLSDRIQSVQCAGVPLKPWLLRCSKKYFNSWISKWQETQSILQGNDLFGYLAKKLNCSQEYVEVLLEKNSLLLTTNVVKLDEMINFLLKKGYTLEEIRLFPKIFCCSVKTIEKRYEEFYCLKGSSPTLPQLSLSKAHLKALKQDVAV